ncbi:peptidoglycan-binding protein [Streptomyces sp. B6B3]|uniref:peptidoglycan-binding protein n=1 Tax=Streptomyces sp. B6B3 TaxID=3153570 RepID=UPI00325D77BA
MRTRVVLAAIAAIAAVGVAGFATEGFGGVGGGDAGAATETPEGPPATAEVQTTTLTQTEEVTGSLGYGDPVTVEAPTAPAEPDATGDSAGAGGGTVTWLPAPGSTVKRGEPLYTVNARPVTLLYGEQPFYRTLEPGAEGTDVELLEHNLVELGYSGFTADDEYTDATAEAVWDWQEDVGRVATGTVSPAEVAVTDGAVRVQQAHIAPGAPATGPVLDVTGTQRRIHVDLDAELEHLVAQDAEAEVELPDGTRLDAVIAEIGAATAEETGQDATQGGEAAPVTIPLTLSVADQQALGDYQAAPVTVRLAAEEREDVLAVPVNALVALREGGYGLEVVEGGGTEYVPVETGMFAGGLVEVSGPGIEAGTVVGVPE